MISSEKSGVWLLDDVYNKDKAEYFSYQGASSSGLHAIGNSSGLAQNAAINRSVPVQIPGTTWDTSKTPKGAAQNVGMAIKTDGTLWVWGANDRGQLGQNNTAAYSSPRQIPGTQWSSIGDGEYKSCCAIKTDGSLWVWGDNQYGILGQGSTSDHRSSPIQIPGTWNNISQGFAHIVGTQTNGTLWAWGYDTYGQIAQVSTAGYANSKSTPREVGGTQWTLARGMMYHSAAKKSDGSVWVWGSNDFGQLGKSTGATRYSSPIQLPGSWANFDGGRFHTVLRKTDGTLWACGGNTAGILGQDNTSTTYYSSPIQIPGTQWDTVSCAYYVSSCTKTDGTLWAWGQNGSGQFGVNDRTHRSSPTQVPGTQWGYYDMSRYNIIGQTTISET